MDCKKCLLFYTENFNHFTGYYKETDRYVSGIEKDCPCGKKLKLFDKVLLKMENLFNKINNRL